jgi:NAD(P)-dependent dehydrogenase (short-subunit alcohol dehydrogenase family)
MASALLHGRRAVVTGACRGIGRAIADRFATEGAEVWIIDLPDVIDPTHDVAGTLGVDLADPDAEIALARLARELGTVDVVVANAGLVPAWRDSSALDRAEWDRVFAVNVWGPAVMLKTFADALAASGRGSAVLMASINGYRAHAEQILYTATKHAVVGLTRAAALDLGRRGIRVNALAPGPIATEALQGRIHSRHAAGGPALDHALAEFAGQTALGRMATEADVAAAAVLLACDLSAGVTGTVLPVECGLA